MELMKVTALHVTEHIRIALAATADNAAEKMAKLAAAGYWKNIQIETFVPMARKRVAL